MASSPVWHSHFSLLVRFAVLLALGALVSHFLFELGDDFFVPVWLAYAGVSSFLVVFFAENRSDTLRMHLLVTGCLLFFFVVALVFWGRIDESFLFVLFGVLGFGVWFFFLLLRGVFSRRSWRS